MIRRLLQRLLAAAAFICLSQNALAYDFVGVAVCAKCHEVQAASWRGTAHAKAFESLKAGVKADEKKKAKLDPAKDYTKDKDCVGCHSTGFGTRTGYAVGMNIGGEMALGTVGCESCHGAGSGYRDAHGEAEKLMKRRSVSTPRKTLVAQGENFDYERACAACHLNYEGSPHKGSKKPVTPFTPTVDGKYKFEYKTAVASKAMHEHFKLKGTYTGEPVPSVRAELQKNAKELPDE
jgi:hypothetical protein